MKLGHIFQSYETWLYTINLKLEPSLAYKIRKYFHLITNEYQIIDKQKLAIINEVTNNDSINFTKESLSFPEYVTKFSEFLEEKSDLEQFDMKLEDFINNISNKNNIISANQINVLEIFFKE